MTSQHFQRVVRNYIVVVASCFLLNPTLLTEYNCPLIRSTHQQLLYQNGNGRATIAGCVVGLLGTVKTCVDPLGYGKEGEGEREQRRQSPQAQTGGEVDADFLFTWLYYLENL